MAKALLKEGAATTAILVEGKATTALLIAPIKAVITSRVLLFGINDASINNNVLGNRQRTERIVRMDRLQRIKGREI